MIFEFYEQKYLEKVYLKLNLAQSTKQERPQISLLQLSLNTITNLILALFL